MVSREFAASPLWGWKSPPTGLLLPLWEDLAQGLGFSLRLVVVFRNPLDVARSLARVWNLPLSQSLRLWLYYMLAVFETVDRHPCLFVQYDEFLADPEAGAQRLGQFLKCADTALPEKVRGIVRPSLRHSWSSLADLAAKADPDLVALYQQCLDRLNGTQTSRPNQDRRLVATLEDYRQWARLADTDADRAPITLDSAVIFDIGDDQDRVVANIIPYAPEGRFDERFALDPVGAKMVLFCPCPGSGKVFFRCRIEEVETDGEFRGIEHKNPGRQEEGWDLFAPGGQPYYKLAGDFTRATYVRIQGRIEVATV